jgi:hypothetical protein
MNEKRWTFQLYIFGALGDYTQPLVTFAEFNRSRAVERVALDKTLIDRLTERIRELHEFIETNSPKLESDALSDLGKQLCDLVLQGKVRALFDRATGGQEILPFEIFVEDYEITSWPWEYLYDSKQGRFLAQEFHPISRGIFALYPPQRLGPLNERVRILLLIGTLPTDSEATPAEEIKWMQEVFATKLATDSVHLEIMQAVNPEDLDKHLQSHQYDVLHFFGHAGFDGHERQGYLKFERAGEDPFQFDALTFAQMLASLPKKTIRLVFLNACESGRTARQEDPARSSIAAALLARGIPAVIATQFSIPDITAHYLSSMIYNGLVIGKPLIEAMQDGRRAMNYVKKKRFTDWGIPVLYTTDPDMILFPPSGTRPTPEWAADLDRAARTDGTLKALGNAAAPNAPSLTVERTALPAEKSRAKMRVALIDFDAKIGFLPDLIEQANKAQHYYHFEVTYLPLPSGAIRTDMRQANGTPSFPQLYVPLLEDYLVTMPEDLGVKKVCCLTRCRIAGETEEGEPFQDYRASALNASEDVIIISLYRLREYAKEAGTSYAKATLYTCLAMIVATDERYDPFIHEETAGCMFDNCRNRDDIVVGMRKMQFDHDLCRSKVTDAEQLAAIDTLLQVEIRTGLAGA